MMEALAGPLSWVAIAAGVWIGIYLLTYFVLGPIFYVAMLLWSITIGPPIMRAWFRYRGVIKHEATQSQEDDIRR
jgi:hypothetical protein